MNIVDALTSVLFFLAIGLIVWVYLGYPLFLAICSQLIRREPARSQELPHVTLVITAHNEEKRIAQKLENALAQDYPAGRLHIIVVSDASVDRTEEIVRDYEMRGVKLMVMPERRGKHYGQGRGVQAASTDVVILSDATTFLKNDAIRTIVRNFADPNIGCVSGQDSVKEDEDSSAGEGAYVRYEMALRRMESKVASIVGASGSFFAVRKDMCDRWIDDMSSDFYLPIMAYMKGFRSIIDEQAIGYYSVLHDPSREFQRKLRTIVHGLEVVFHLKSILNPFRYGLYSIQMWSHKLLRWIVPFAMLVAYFANIPLLPNGLTYQIIFVLQNLLYLAALAGHLLPSLQRILPVRLSLYLVMVNLSILMAWIQFWRGKKYVVWKATER